MKGEGREKISNCGKGKEEKKEGETEEETKEDKTAGEEKNAEEKTTDEDKTEKTDGDEAKEGDDKDTLTKVKDALENIKLPKMHRPAFLKKKAKDDPEKVSKTIVNL